MNYYLIVSLNKTWHEFRFLPQSLQVHSDYPAERSQAWLFPTIQHEVMLDQNLTIRLAGKYNHTKLKPYVCKLHKSKNQLICTLDFWEVSGVKSVNLPKGPTTAESDPG